jgi:ribosome assembly protein 1
LDAVCETGPSPAEAAKSYRTKVLALQMPKSLGENGVTSAEREAFISIQEAVRQCDLGESEPTVAHVCRFTSTNRSSVTDPDLPPIPPDADPSSFNMIMGIARVLSGTLRSDDIDYYTFGPRYEWGNTQLRPKQKIRCYLLMGSSFVRVPSVPAGHICAIHDLEALQLKTVTLCDQKECMPLRGFDFSLQPLVKVNVEPVSASGELLLSVLNVVFFLLCPEFLSCAIFSSIE